MANKLKTIYVCGNCGETTPRWLGKCPSCNEWNTLVEDVIEDTPAKERSKKSAARVQSVQLREVDVNESSARIKSGFPEIDRVLGGGIVEGSLVLLGGEPGAGKSTLLLQLCDAVEGNKTSLYITGEESTRQIKLRADRLKLEQQDIYIAAETDIDIIIALIQTTKPDLVVIDSIQTMVSNDLNSSPGSVSQVKETAARLLHVAKQENIPIFIVGHVNKDGAIAGPKVMEHIVDTVLYFEGNKMLPYRVLRAVKNRYGSTNEIGMFDMGQFGLKTIENPSKMLLEGRAIDVSGNCVCCVMEGTKPILVEIQALATKTGFGTPRRAMTGVDSNRANLLMAIIEKRAEFILSNLDVYINVVGGIQLDETGCDLAVCLAVISSILDTPIPNNLIAVGEVGLGGEIRSVSNVTSRLKEAERTGFDVAIVPQTNYKSLQRGDIGNIKVIGAEFLKDCIKHISKATP